MKLSMLSKDIGEYQDIENSEPLLLYLRPFELDDRISDVDPRYQIKLRKKAKWQFLWYVILPLPIWLMYVADPSHSLIYDGEIFEKHLIRQTRRCGILLGLRVPKQSREFVGYPEVREWKRHVITLMRHAQVIYCTVHKSEGVLWEINKIVEMGFLLKTIFIWPGMAAYWGRGFKEIEQLFGEICDSIRWNIRSPEIDPRVGCFFMYREKETGRQWEVQQWPTERFGDIESVTVTTINDTRRKAAAIR
jgi:hypothetical protein